MTFLAQSQISQPNLFHRKQIMVTKPNIQVHHFSIQKMGFKIVLQDSLPMPPADYQMNFVKGRLYLKNFKTYQNIPITIYYLEYPEAFRKVYKKYDNEIVKQDSLQSIKLLPDKNTQTPKPFDGLKTQGSIIRGFSVGNNQNLVMQSELDLKIEGQLSDKLKVKAVLNDNNLPQAYAGISQSYKEFNRIYLQLSAPDWSATGGDLLLNEQSDYFLKFQRKAQGLSVQIGQNNHQLKVTGGIIDGQFGINRFKGIDGNQGPYTLKGNQGENYIFIIPDSDKVYVNGQLLKRGLDQDYTINYDTAELRFNPTFPVTSNQRIVVEFNYSNQHYVRYLNYNRYRHQNNKSSWSVFSFIETDAKNQTLLYDLTPEQVEALKNAGDKIDELWIEAAKPASYDENKILYKKIQNGTTSYYKYTNQDEPDLYEVKFSYVGQNKGHYQISQVTAIGKIYEYAGPNQGDYEPKIKLTPPVSKKYAGVNYHYNPNTKTDLFMSGIINHTDQNLFSTIDDQNNIGGAFHLKWDQNIWQKAEKNIRLLTKYDYVDANFTPLDPYRPVEFNREWQIDSLFGRQHLADIGVVYENKTNYIKLGNRYFNFRNSLSANQMYLNSQWQQGKWENRSDYQYTIHQADYQLQSAFINQNITYHFKHFDIGATGHFENRNKQNNKVYDSLNYKYAYGELKWQKRDSARWQVEVAYRKERNDSIYFNQWFMANETDQISLHLQEKNDRHKIGLFMQYRLQNTLQQHQKKRYPNLKIDWQQAYWQKFLQTNLQIESYNGNTLRDEVVFVETPPGQGVYVWNDYNGNGIKEINEFEVAVYQDQSNYIRVVLPSKNYIPTLNNRYAFQLTVNPAVWQKKSFLKKLYGVIRFEKSHQSEQQQTRFPLIWQPDNILINNNLWQNDWFFNRAKKRFFAHFTYQHLTQEQLLLVGKQSHQLKLYQLETKHTFWDSFVWKQELAHKKSANSSENYAQKNYRLNTKTLEEGIEWQRQKTQKLYAYYNFKNKLNLLGSEHLKMHKIGLRYTYSANPKNNFYTDLQWINNQFYGNASSPVAYQMLEALQPGKNIVFNMMYQQKINSYLQLNLNYNFRLSEQQAAIHTGGIQVKMLF